MSYCYIYLEFLKVIIENQQNKNILENSLLMWGNHDFLKVKICPQDEEPISWLKKTYEDNHSENYDGVEHQPLYLCGSNDLRIVDTLADLCKGQTSPSERENIYLISLLQVDLHEKFSMCPNEIVSVDECALDKFLAQINYICNDEANGITATAMWNIGESDIAVLFKTQTIEIAANKIAELRQNLPIIQNDTLLIFPYCYNELQLIVKQSADATNSLKIELTNNLSKWFAAENGTIYNTSTHFVLDRNHQQILDCNHPLRKHFQLVFGDYDIELVTSPKELILNGLALASPKNEYLYSETSPLLPLPNIDVNPLKTPPKDYNSEILRLKNAFQEVITEPDKLGIDRAQYFKESFENAARTLISLYNFFIHLDETSYASDIFIHIKHLFNGITAAMETLSKYCKIDSNKNWRARMDNDDENNIDEADYVDDRYDVLIEADTHLKVLLESIQQLLGIISLSPHSYSELQSGYMRSANASIKLLCAYQTAAYLMHKNMHRTPQGDLIPQNKFLYERNEYAVLILPTRNSKMSTSTLFESLSPEHHISVIETNFHTLFSPKTMLFGLAHEVGHFSGDRKRAIRLSFIIHAVLRYILDQSFDPIMCSPYHFVLPDGSYSVEEWSIIDFLEESIDENLHNYINNLRKNITDIANESANILVSKIQDKQKILSAESSSNSGTMPFCCGYIHAIQLALINVFNSEAQKHNLFNRKDSVLESNINSILTTVASNCYQREEFPFATRWHVMARAMVEYTPENIKSKINDHLDPNYLSQYFGEAIQGVCSIFEESYSDIYAIRTFGLKDNEYIERILENEMDGRVFDNWFWYRFYVVLKGHYNLSGGEISQRLAQINDFPEPWKVCGEKWIKKLSTAETYYLKPYLDYIQLFDTPEWFNEYTSSTDSILLTDFYHNPGEYLYNLWQKGCKKE